MKNFQVLLFLISFNFATAQTILHKYKLISYITQKDNALTSQFLNKLGLNENDDYFFVYTSKDTSILFVSNELKPKYSNLNILAVKINNKFYKKTKNGLVNITFSNNNLKHFEDEYKLKITTTINDSFMYINNRACLLLLCPQKLITNSYFYKLINNEAKYLDISKIKLVDSISVTNTNKTFAVENIGEYFTAKGLNSGNTIFVLLPKDVLVDYIANKNEKTLLGRIEKDLASLKNKNYNIEIVTDDVLNIKEQTFLFKNFNCKHVNVDNNFMINLLIQQGLEAKIIITNKANKVLTIKNYMDLMMENKNLNDLVLQVNNKELI